MATSLALKRLDDLMDEIGSLRKNIDDETKNVKLEGIWENASVGEEDIREAKSSLFEEVE